MSTKQSLVFTEGSSVRNLAADRIVGRVQKSKIRAQGRTTPHFLCRLGAVLGPFSPLESVVLGLLLAQAAFAPVSGDKLFFASRSTIASETLEGRLPFLFCSNILMSHRLVVISVHFPPRLHFYCCLPVSNLK